MLNTETLSSWARALGFAQVGFCGIDPFIHSQRIVQAQKTLAERKQLRYFPEEDFPHAKSIAVLLWPYFEAQLPKAGEVFVDSYYAASNAAYHAARILEEKVQASGCFAKANVPYPAKEAAIRARLGCIGHHSLLITPQHGSRVVIILMATDIEFFDEGYPEQPKSCLKCGRCAAACPSGALDDQGLSHPERCLRNFTMEGIIVPEDFRSKIGMRLIGCDICQRVCPMQPRMKPTSPAAYPLSDLITEDAVRFSDVVAKLSEQIGRNAARPQRIRAQAALLAGNSRNKSYLPVLRTWAELPFDAVREHSRWAIHQIESAAEHT